MTHADAPQYIAAPALPVYIVNCRIGALGPMFTNDPADTRQQIIESIEPGDYCHERGGYHEATINDHAIIWIMEARADGTWSDVTQELCHEALLWQEGEDARIAAEARAIKQRVYDSVVAAERRPSMEQPQ